MTLTNKTLDILFRLIEPEDVLQTYYRRPRVLKDLFMTKAESELGGYSFEEKENAYYHFLGNRESRLWINVPPQFFLLAEKADDLLETGVHGPVCKFDKIEEWRDVYLLLGQDLLTMSWLARESFSRPVRRWFSWPAIIPVNNPILNRLTKDLAENHMHLMAGASTFSLTWCCLMNHPEAILRDREELSYFLQPHMSRGTSEIWSHKRRIQYAAYIRMLLFKRTRGEVSDIMGKFLLFHALYTTDEWTCQTVSQEIDGLRHIYGLRLSQPGTLRRACLDYAFTEELRDQREEHSRLLAGERLFLFQCFRMCYDNTLSSEEQWVFYLYLLLKSQFRSELVQVNQQVGFHNFHDYDDRKALLWKKDYLEYVYEDYRQTVNANIHEQHISSLEGRISPAETADQNIRRVHAIDQAYAFNESDEPQRRQKINQWQPNLDSERMLENANHFYVLHFPKVADPYLRQPQRGKPVCRHHDFRKEVRKKAIALATALSNSDYYCGRIRGIDACSFEIVCRPEVFGTAFRFLRSFPAEHYRRNSVTSHMPRLGITYHAGEDFLDIADGLRAIDEAVHFLGMRRGDRLGHATVLGVDPALHYSTKSRQIILTKQEALDTYVWIYYRCGELGVEIPLILRQQLLRKASSLFSEIYRNQLMNGDATLEDYYFSMKLRGDDPRCYESGIFQYPRITDGFDMYCLNNGDDSLPSLRSQRRITELCFCYHYSYEILEAGNTMYTASVEDDYICLMGQLQQAMRRHVNNAGISIECNPSSNVLIGTFGTYDKHPIMTLYNKGLGNENGDVQMHVSVNTDDPGVFDTSLSFEYALLANTLQNITNESGQRVNSDRAIEAYIRDIVRMGHEQCFLECI